MTNSLQNLNDPIVNVENLYHELNKHLFDGSLPADYRIEFVPIAELSPDYGDEGGSHDGVSRTIKLTQPLRDRPQSLRRMLIHEMVHAAEGDAHDEAFFNRLVDIAKRGEEWAWNEARDYHPCKVRTLIHLWRRSDQKLRQELDPRRSCNCEACNGWKERGFPSDEPLEQWRPWEPQGAPVQPHSEWIEHRAYELVRKHKCKVFLSAWEQARREAESLQQGLPNHRIKPTRGTRS